MNNELSIIADVINANDDSEEKVDFVHGWRPDADLDMMYHFNNINIGNCNVYVLFNKVMLLYVVNLMELMFWN